MKKLFYLMSLALVACGSGEQEAQVKILYNVIDEGYLTPRLSDLEEGDTLWITQPRGEFTDNQDPAVWTYNNEPAQYPSIQHCLFYANAGAVLSF